MGTQPNRTLGLHVVLALHDINQAMQYSDAVVVMKKGSIRYSGTVREVFTESMIEEVYGIQTVMRWCDVNECHYVMPSKLTHTHHNKAYHPIQNKNRKRA